MNTKFKLDYSPTYFLAALGNGGLAVSFFMYLMFMTNHPDHPIPTYEDVVASFTGSTTSIKVLIVVASLGILYFGIIHLVLLFKNVVAYQEFKKTNSYKNLKNSNAEISLMVMPLTFAMAMNVLFIIGAVFVPGLWSVVEYLFVGALSAFAIIAFFALKIFIGYYARIILNGDFNFIENNNLGQLIASFAFAMIAVSFAAPGAMSHVTTTSAIGLTFSLIFFIFSLFIMLIKVVLGFKSILKHGIRIEDAPSLWIIIPIFTLFGITAVRIISGLSHNFLHGAPSTILIGFILTLYVATQIIFGLLGYAVLRNSHYFKDYIHGQKESVGAYSLICPGVASFVMGMFFLHWTFVKNGVIDKFGLAYFIFLLPLIYIQVKTILTLKKNNKKLLTN